MAITGYSQMLHFIHEENIARFSQQLAATTGESERVMLRKLIADEEAAYRFQATHNSERKT